MSSRLAILLYGCGTKKHYQDELEAVETTYMTTAAECNVPMYVFLEEAPSFTGKPYIHLPCVGDEYESNVPKTFQGLLWMLNNVKFDSVLVIGTDTYPNIPKILEYLETVDLSKPLYIGGHGSIRLFYENNIYYHDGGPGFIVTRTVLEALRPWLSFIPSNWDALTVGKVFPQPHLNFNVFELRGAGDVAFAYYATNLVDGLQTLVLPPTVMCACTETGSPCHIGQIEPSKVMSCHRLDPESMQRYKELLDSNNHYLSSRKIKMNSTYERLCITPLDINEHLPTLYEYASTCNHVTECGVRSFVSSYAFGKALMNRPNTKLVQVDPDLNTPEYINFIDACKDVQLDTVFHEKSDLDCPIETTDLLFIDTWHVYGQMKRELARWAEHTTKYIVMHDTTLDAVWGETIRCGCNPYIQSQTYNMPINEIVKGIWPAIQEFLDSHNEWCIDKKYENNNGLTIIKRVM